MYGERGNNEAEVTPLLKKPPALFSPGHRMRMNIVPMFLNVFLPWGIFVYCFSLSSFYLMYATPLLAWLCISAVFVLWILFVLAAFCARKYDPDPTWFTFFSILAAICAVWGILAGLSNLKNYEDPYYTLQEMRDAKGANGSGVNPSLISGEDVMDAGILTFQQGSIFDADKSWHFMRGELYCVAPLIGPGVSTPLRQTYDFWVVGKDCCASGASDFRCGSWGSTTAHTGLREVNEADLQYYRLAVQQAESLYDIMAPHPIFLKWSQDPKGEVNALHATAFRNFLVLAASNLLFDIMAVLLASARYAFLGRSRSPYDEVLNQAPELPKDFHAHSYA
mmetsp:Transcript_16616/g.31415  ORF Transcript_16616/g.31415 Transcript_16616/m.31415 type:complete len:336 (-) Transcript_16616:35-1042(-)